MAMSVARPAVIRAFASVAFAVLGVCCMNLLVMDEGAMHPRWARGAGARMGGKVREGSRGEVRDV